MEWAASSDEVIIQQLNRLQNTNIVMLGDVALGKVRPILTEKEDAWVDVAWGDIDWDKKVWRAATSSGSTAASVSCGPANATAGDTSIRFRATAKMLSSSRRGTTIVIAVENVDKRRRLDLFHRLARQRNAALSVPRRLNGEGKAERLTPAMNPALTATSFRRAADLAIHTFSTFFNRARDRDRAACPHTPRCEPLIDNKALHDRHRETESQPAVSSSG